MKKLILIILLLSTKTFSADNSLENIQRIWAQAMYTYSDNKSLEVLRDLEKKLYDETNIELVTWRGIIRSSLAKYEGGLKALKLVKLAKKDFEAVIDNDESVLSGSALTSLGTLYFMVPSWPVSFGNNDKAEYYLKKALALNPNGIDPNYFYAQYLMSKRDYKSALKYLDKAKLAKIRKNRPIAENGRRKEIDLAIQESMNKMKGDIILNR